MVGLEYPGKHRWPQCHTADGRLADVGGGAEDEHGVQAAAGEHEHEHHPPARTRHASHAGHPGEDASRRDDEVGANNHESINV